MFIYDIIEKKRKGLVLSKEEIDFVVGGFVAGDISKEQMSSLLMAMVINGLNYDETLNLTLSMKNSSETIEFKEFIVDKHSTGGVSDSTTLIIVPTLASLGVKIGKMSGRSLGFTGGTIDKLEVFEGYDAEKSTEEFTQIINKINCSIISQTKNIALADKLIYSLRNETATVDSIGLIASSIMSKKLASGAKFLLLNVTYGYGAFMKTKKDAIKLAKIMTKIGNDSGVKTVAVVSKMFAPLSNGVGCSQEVYSVIDALKGVNTPLLHVSKYLASVILKEVKGVSFRQAKKQVNETLKSGKALKKFAQLIKAHGGNDKMVSKPSLIGKSAMEFDLVSQKDGYISEINALGVAKVVNHLKTLNPKKDTVKHEGVKLLVEVGSKVEKDQAIAKIYTNSKKKIEESLKDLENAIKISKVKVWNRRIIDKVIYK